MSACCWSRDRAQLVTRVAPGLCSPIVPDSGGEVALVEDAEQRQCLTDRVECDAETAAIRALGQYLAMLERDHLGRRVAFETVTEGWPEVMVQNRFPAVGITSAQPGAAVYDRRQTPATEKIHGAPDGMVFVKTTDWNGRLKLLIVANDKEERIALRMMVEEALFPHDFCGGVRMVVPFYAGMHFEYTLLSGGFEDSPEALRERVWPMTFELAISVPVFRIDLLPMAKLVTRGRVVSSQDPVPEDRALTPRSIR